MINSAAQHTGSTREHTGWLQAQAKLLIAAPSAFCLLALVLFLVLVPTASAKSLDGYIPDATGIQINDIAVNEANGDLYVTSGGDVRRFAADGTFELAWGKDVVAGNAETGHEVCVAASQECKQGTSGQLKGEFIGSSSPAGLAIDQGDGSVYVWDSRSGNGPSQENLRIQKFDADGNFVLMFGKQVNATTGGDVCTEVSGDTCQAGLETSDPGGFGNPSTTSPGLAVSPIDGDVFVADHGGISTPNNRIQRFESDGTFVEVIGSAAEFGPGGPRAIAIDSQGIVYASDSNNDSEVDRYDAYGAHGAPDFLAPIPAPPLLIGSTSAFGSQNATPGLEVDLDSEGDGAPGLDTDSLYVLRDPDANGAETVIQQFDSPGELAAPASVDAVHGAGDGFSEVGGLGFNSVSGDLYVSDRAGEDHLFVLSDGGDGIAPPSVSFGEVTNIGTNQVDVTAHVDPGGEQASYRFEYAAGGGEFIELPAGTVSGEGSQPVGETITGLTPGSPYRVRVYVEKVAGPESVSTALSEESLFFTATAPPEATNLSPHSYTDTDAWLAGKVNPNGEATTYRFEWGVSTAYENRVPASDAFAGSGGTEKAFIQKIEGLEPNTTYHYRIVAENDQGTDASEDFAFTTRPAFAGFARRAYEQVSPVDKNEATLLHEDAPGSNVSATPVAPDGSAAVFLSRRAFADADWVGGVIGGSFLRYQARRNPAGDGWTTRSMVPPPFGFDASFGAGLVQDVFFGGPGDSKIVFRVGLHQGDIDGDGAPDSNNGGFIRDWHSGELTKFVNIDPNAIRIVGGSADLNHIVFMSEEVLTEEPGVPAAGDKVYEWADGEIRLASIDVGGAPFAAPAVAGRGISGAAAEFLVKRSAISTDGAHIFFTVPALDGGSGSEFVKEAKIYRRSHGATTTLVSPSRASPPDSLGPLAKLFLYATPDGDDVFFMSSEQLTDNANTGPDRDGRDFYRYRASTDSLVDISASTNDADGAQVRGMLGASDDGHWVYYVARGRVVAGEGTPGADNVYLWHDDGSPQGETRFIATLAPGPVDSLNLGRDGGTAAVSRERWTSARVSPDGSTLVFQSEASLTGYPNQGHAQIYVYEAGANGGKGSLSCVSCRPNGSPAHGPVEVRAATDGSESGRALARFLSTDGSRIFFQSSDALLPADANGKKDVYVWEAGRLALISTGASEFDSYLQGASESGDDVFFLTRQELVGQDGDGVHDVYDARVGGGIPEQSPPPPGESCVGDACKPDVSDTSSPDAPASSHFTGPGNVAAKTEATSNCARLTRRVRRIGNRAKRMRRMAGRAAANRSRGRARQLRRRARRLNKRVKELSKRAQRCRQAQRRSK